MEAIQAVDDVLTELGQFMTEELAATAMALGGLRIFAAQVAAALPSETAEGQAYLVGTDVPDIGWILRINDAVAAGSLVDQVSGAGVMVQRITQQLIVRLYAGWEEDFRKRLAKAHNFRSKNSIKSTFFGDLGQLRHDIVHNLGRVGSRTAAGCSVIAEPLRRGDPIFLSDIDLQALRFRMPWRDLLHAVDADPPSA